MSRDKEIIIRKRKREEGCDQSDCLFTPTHFSARARVIDLNAWHHAIRQVTGDMALQFNKATPADLKRWARTRARWLEEMEG